MWYDRLVHTCAAIEEMGSDRMSRNEALLSAMGAIALIIGLTMGICAFAAPSSPADLIAFTRGEGRAQEVAVYDLETRTEKHITDNNVWDGLPALSPSGRWLAFVRATPKRDALTKSNFVLHRMFPQIKARVSG